MINSKQPLQEQTQMEDDAATQKDNVGNKNSDEARLVNTVPRKVEGISSSVTEDVLRSYGDRGTAQVAIIDDAIKEQKHYGESQVSTNFETVNHSLV